jgi:hypothetical protein
MPPPDSSRAGSQPEEIIVTTPCNDRSVRLSRRARRRLSSPVRRPRASAWPTALPRWRRSRIAAISRAEILVSRMRRSSHSATASQSIVADVGSVSTEITPETIATNHRFCRNIAAKFFWRTIRWKWQNSLPLNAKSKSRCDDLGWLRNFRDRASDSNLFRFYVVWNSTWRFRINDDFSVTLSKPGVASDPWTIFDFFDRPPTTLKCKWVRGPRDLSCNKIHAIDDLFR